MAASPGYVFGGNTGITQESLKRRRAVVEAMMEQAQNANPKNLGEGINALGKGIAAAIAGRGLRQDEAALRDQQAGLWTDLGSAIAVGSSSSLAYDPAGSSDTFAPRLKASAADNDNGLQPFQTAFLDTIAGPESGGAYNVKYGGGTFSDFADHPRTDVPINSGPNSGKTSSAAGRYQFLGSTWDEQKNKLGLSDFSPANQDRAAWALAADTYRKQTGNDLSVVLQSGDPDAIAGAGKALSGVWTSLPGGIEQGTNVPRFTASYRNALGRNGGTTPRAANDPAAGDQPVAVDRSDAYAPGYQRAMLAASGPQQSVQVASLDPAIGMDSALAYNPRGRMEAAPQTTASLAPLPPAQTVAANPVPPAASQFSRPVQDAAAADPNFDGFAQSGPTRKVAQALLAQNGPGLPDIPAAPATSAGGTSADFAREAYPDLPPGSQRVAHALEVQQARNGENLSALLRVLQSPYASDEQRQLAGQILNHLYARQEKLEDRAYEENSPTAVQRRRLVDAQIAAASAKGTGFRTLTAHQATALGLPAGTVYQIGPDNKIDAIGNGKGQSINVNTGSDSGDFYKEADKARGKNMNDLADAGATAQRSLIQIDELDKRLANVGTGGLAAMKQFAASYGLPVGDMSDSQAATALINQLIPAQRPPGSGSMSDGDVAMFRQSLPSIVNQPGGNALIIRTLRGIAQYDAARGDIANRVLDRDITPAEGRRLMGALPPRQIGVLRNALAVSAGLPGEDYPT